MVLGSKPVDKLPVLAEKMKSPGFYSSPTLQACGYAGSSSARQALAAALSPNVPRNGQFISLAFQSDSPESARRCLEGVLQDVVSGQASAFEAAKAVLMAERGQLERQLEKLKTDQAQLESVRRDSLGAVQEQLGQTRLALQKLDTEMVKQSSGKDTVSVLMLLNLRSDVQQLESALMALQSSLSTVSFESEDKVVLLTERLAALELAVNDTNTRPATYVTGINAPESKVSPRRSLITVLSVLIGGFVGLLVLIARRAWIHIKAHEATRRTQIT